MTYYKFDLFKCWVFENLCNTKSFMIWNINLVLTSNNNFSDPNIEDVTVKSTLNPTIEGSIEKSYLSVLEEE